jgi:hypothetical protein
MRLRERHGLVGPARWLRLRHRQIETLHFSSSFSSEQARLFRVDLKCQRRRSSAITLRMPDDRQKSNVVALASVPEHAGSETVLRPLLASRGGRGIMDALLALFRAVYARVSSIQ